MLHRINSMRDDFAEKLTIKVIEVLKEERAIQGLSHEKLAAKARIHRTAISHLENGIRKPTFLVVIKLSRALGFDVSEIVKRAENRDEK